jgi:hypothetical protein
MSTPEGRELRRQWSTKPRINGGRPKGVPDGHTKETIAVVRKEAKKSAKETVDMMAKKFNIEDEYQKDALRTAVEIMRTDGQTRERLAAARLVLDFTKSKPATRSEVSIGKAEDFLASLVLEVDAEVEEEESETDDDRQKIESSTPEALR